jgi:hypothetical protein
MTRVVNLMSVCACFPYIESSSFVFIRYIVRSRKLTELWLSFSTLNLMFVYLLNSVRASSMFVFHLIVNYENTVNISKVPTDLRFY